MKERCGVKHKFGDVTCIRPIGHDGLCWGKAIRSNVDGHVTRCEWYSEGGKFKSHYQYRTMYPRNAERANP